MTTFNDRWAEHGAWRHEFSFLLRLFSQWLKDNTLLDASVEARIKHLEQKVRHNKMTVAFVAEFSRGKSEMINALFFAAYGRRIMPASAGRTTMCPTEIGYEPGIAACLRLLPIRTRLQPQSLLEWRATQEAWDCSILDIKDPEQLARTLERVTDTIQVSRQDAQALGFWHSQTPQDNPPLDAHGFVQIPKWRHALVNIAHPLLEQGLVILDTPGLNAIGAEPELTVGLLAHAQAVVFILGADTGVTQSDLRIWQQHLVTEKGREGPTLVVLNKIDMLWDELSTLEEVKTQIERQTVQAAQALGQGAPEILAVSARKGLIAKVNNDAELLDKSGIMALEDALAQRMLGQRHRRVCAAVAEDLSTLEAEINRTINARQRDLAEQRLEMDGMQGKSRMVLEQMGRRIAREQQRFEVGCNKFIAIKGVRTKRFHEIMRALNYRTLSQDMAILQANLARPGLKLGAKRAYAEAFERVRLRLHKTQAIAQDVYAMHMATFAQINTEFGFTLHCPEPPSLEPYLNALDNIEFAHTKYVGVRNLLQLQQSEFIQRLVRALQARLKQTFESASAEMDRWRTSLADTLEAQVGLRRTNFTQRLEAVKKVQQVANGIELRQRELSARQSSVNVLERKLSQQTACLVAANEDAWNHSAN